MKFGWTCFRMFLFQGCSENPLFSRLLVAGVLGDGVLTFQTGPFGSSVLALANQRFLEGVLFTRFTDGREFPF